MQYDQYRLTFQGLYSIWRARKVMHVVILKEKSSATKLLHTVVRTFTVVMWQSQTKHKMELPAASLTVLWIKLLFVGSLHFQHIFCAWQFANIYKSVNDFRVWRAATKQIFVHIAHFFGTKVSWCAHESFLLRFHHQNQLIWHFMMIISWHHIFISTALCEKLALFICFIIYLWF